MLEDIGWGKSIKETLNRHNLPTDLHTIAQMSKNEWSSKVKNSIEICNKERLLENCYKTEDGIKNRKTKTASIVDSIMDPNYQRTPLPEIMKCTKKEAKTILIARFKMLECGNNFKGSQSQMCRKCNILDNENHRLNFCTNFKATNYYDDDTKVDFNTVFSNDIHELRDIVPKLMKTWNMQNANGTMNE